MLLRYYWLIYYSELMSDGLKIAAIVGGVGLAIYGLVRLCTRKCKKCGA